MNKIFTKKLEKLRSKIDSADKKLLSTLAARFKVVTKIAALKKKQKVEARQNSRWEKVLKDRVSKAKKLKLDQKFCTELFNLIHEESIKFQNSLNKKVKQKRKAKKDTK
ncbi:MAG: chorismate mutase [Bacteriovoracaceae bacterium]